jgi:hypothetical protein
MLRHVFTAAIIAALAITPLRSISQAPTSTEPKVLTASEAGAILPPSVFFRGQSASIQARNSGGVQFSKDALFLATLVDTSGYSSAVQQKYQAYLITESAIEIGGHRLVPGAYGVGFIAEDTFLVMDIGGHDLFTTKSTHDANLRRPTPLQVVSTPDVHKWRLYAGRNFVEFALAPSATR